MTRTTSTTRTCCRISPRPSKEVQVPFSPTKSRVAFPISTTATGSDGISGARRVVVVEEDHLYDDDVREQLNVLCRFESTSYQCRDYVQLSQQRQRQNEQRGNCNKRVSRPLTVEFLMNVVDFGNYPRHLVTYAMTILMDRYLSCSCNCASDDDSNRLVLDETLLDRNQYQLVALTCLYMAIKMFEPENMGVECLVPLNGNRHSVQDFEDMESRILTCLNWRVGFGPTPLTFVELLLQHYLLVVVDDDDSEPEERCRQQTQTVTTSLYHHAQYQLELAVSDYDLCCTNGIKPSELAVAALWNALEGMDVKTFSLQNQYLFQSKVLEVLSMTTAREQQERIGNLQERLANLMLEALSFTTASETETAPKTTTDGENEKKVVATGGDDQRQQQQKKNRHYPSPVSVVRRENLEKQSRRGRDRHPLVRSVPFAAARA